MPLDSASRPLATNARPAIAMRYHEAREGARAAETEKSAATAAAVKCGVLFDHRAHPEEPGTERQVYDDGTVRIMLKVTEPSEKLDTGAFIAALVSVLKVPTGPLQKLVAKHTHPTSAAHSFTSSLIG
jgi:hypothetical protein